MPSFVWGAAVTLLAWTVLSIQFVGLGLLLMRVVGLSSGRSAHASLAFWLGFGLTLACLQVWSLFWPVSTAALLPLLVLGLAGWAVNGRGIVGRVHELGRFKGRWALVLALCVWGALYAQAPLTLYDAGIYHLDSIRWASTFPAVPGLGNLGPAFGINSTAFLFISALNAANVPGFHIALGLLIAVLLLELLSIARLPVGDIGENSARRPRTSRRSWCCQPWCWPGRLASRRRCTTCRFIC